MNLAGKIDALRAAFAGAALLALAGCADTGPETHLNWPVATYYTVVVRPGDKVDDIAARYNVSAASVLRMNDLQGRSAIYPGEVLRIPPGGHTTRTTVLREAESSHIYAVPRTHDDPVATVPLHPVRIARNDPPVQSQPADVAPAQSDSALRFIWPVAGTVIESFGGMATGERNDGINIAAQLGAPIRASQSGTVSYAGNELRSYGNLILIKHDGGYITAYAHVESIAVGRGQHVEQGQIIGTAGTTGDVKEPQLHFEIRRDSHPVDPRLLLVAAR
jgi:murein DD-endopeptidase MepM/ murein hydrolase activator NlpD